MSIYIVQRGTIRKYSLGYKYYHNPLSKDRAKLDKHGKEAIDKIMWNIHRNSRRKKLW